MIENYKEEECFLISLSFLYKHQILPSRPLSFYQLLFFRSSSQYSFLITRVLYKIKGIFLSIWLRIFFPMNISLQNYYFLSSCQKLWITWPSNYENKESNIGRRSAWLPRLLSLHLLRCHLPRVQKIQHRSKTMTAVHQPWSRGQITRIFSVRLRAWGEKRPTSLALFPR